MISNRLLKIINLITPKNIVVDIGCDHGFMDIELIKRNISKKVIACDIGEGPLNNAKHNIKNCGFESFIEMRISDGLSNISINEGQTLVMAGLGGNTIISILEKDFNKVLSFDEIIVEPQSDIFKVRKYLFEKNLTITFEDMVCESNKYYPIIKVFTKNNVSYQNISECELMYGPCLLKTKNPVLLDFLDKELNRLNIIYDNLILNKANENSKAKTDIYEKIKLINYAIKKYYS